MILEDAFLLTSAIAYLVAAVGPVKVSKNLKIEVEKIVYLIFAIVILANMWILNLDLLWVVMGFTWVVAAYTSYTGIQEWNVKWKFESSDEAQMFMTGWNLAIAVICFTKLTF